MSYSCISPLLSCDLLTIQKRQCIYFPNPHELDKGWSCTTIQLSTTLIQLSIFDMLCRYTTKTTHFLFHPNDPTMPRFFPYFLSSFNQNIRQIGVNPPDWLDAYLLPVSGSIETPHQFVLFLEYPRSNGSAIGTPHSASEGRSSTSQPLPANAKESNAANSVGTPTIQTLVKSQDFASP
jgi:hypothetical protein